VVRVVVPTTATTPWADGELTLEERLLLRLDDLGPSALESLDEGQWLVHFAQAPPLGEVAAELREEFGPDVTSVLEWLPDEDWAARTQAQLKAVTVGSLIIAPPWDRPSDVTAEQIVIEIEPSTGFGTGHHQSTRLCLRALQRECRSGLSMLDVGTGSGVLAIAASRLGCSRVVAIDLDPDACRSARENVARNGVSDTVEVLVEGLGARPRSSNVVVANLTADVVYHHAHALTSTVAEGGRLIVSGIMTSQVPLVLEALSALTTVSVDEEEDWVAITLAR
jgi:ribosomal protein L11 methyltransferase